MKFTNPVWVIQGVHVLTLNQSFSYIYVGGKIFINTNPLGPWINVAVSLKPHLAIFQLSVLLVEETGSLEKKTDLRQVTVMETNWQKFSTGIWSLWMFKQWSLPKLNLLGSGSYRLQRFHTLKLYSKFSLYRIPFYSDFILDRFHCIILIILFWTVVSSIPWISNY